MPMPLSKAGKAWVTSHGDFHFENASKIGNNVRTLDTDMAAVQYAIGDISYHFYVTDTLAEKPIYMGYQKGSAEVRINISSNEFLNLSQRSIKMQRRFLKAYLTERKMSAKESDIDLLQYDAMCAMAYMSHRSIVSPFKRINYTYLNRIVEFQRKANKSKDLQKKVRESNIIFAQKRYNK